jgi:hypothetical protein
MGKDQKLKEDVLLQKIAKRTSTEKWHSIVSKRSVIPIAMTFIEIHSINVYLVKIHAYVVP